MRSFSPLSVLLFYSLLFITLSKQSFSLNMTKEQALKLAKSQLADGWDKSDIRAYFTMLEDPFFANWVIANL